ncbi:hypothetical protein [Ruminococcus albus]|uniref:Zinc-ribbon domain-containing protein n=1 Tax=Ruminococcus albus TaxID=1264 RepID=A0A1I1KJM8_RUMAL|nr:hypothetical protein [Ruminococcus albus]SFC61066.1 hypothetical protein SAMN02910406_02041 [Ruminococcus albus]
MVCKTCGAVINDSDTICKNCGDTIRVDVDNKVNLAKGISPEEKFRQQAAQFGGITVKEKRGTIFAGMDPKMISYILIAITLLIFTLVFFIYDRKRTTINVDGFEVTLPVSMRDVDDFSFEVMKSEKCRSFANTEMEFTYVIYDVTTVIPELSIQPAANDVDALMEYYEGKDKLVTLKTDFTNELNETFSDQLKDYDLIENESGLLRFTYKDTAMTNNYVEMHIEIVDDKVYQFSLLCSDDRRDKVGKTIDEVYKSLKIDK